MGVHGLIERDLVDVLGGLVAARGVAREVDALAQLVGQGQLFGVGEVDPVKDQ
jgi:hypothetical protein